MRLLSAFHRRVLRKSVPALVVILLVFVSLLLLISYTDAFYLVILLWIVAPVLLVRAFRWLRGRLSPPE